MIVCSAHKVGNASAIAAGGLLIAFSAASIGCAFAAVYGIGAVAPQPVTSPALAVPVVNPPAAHMAGVTEPVRCPTAFAVRARRSACRLADVPPV